MLGNGRARADIAVPQVKAEAPRSRAPDVEVPPHGQDLRPIAHLVGPHDVVPGRCPQGENL